MIENLDLGELWRKANAAGACLGELKAVRSYKDVPTLLAEAPQHSIEYWVLWYADTVLDGRWLDVEPMMLERFSSDKLCEYAATFNFRWPEAEPVIMKDPGWAWDYACRVIKRRWPEAEPVIMKEPRWACNYTQHLVQGRWPEAESCIGTDPCAACHYALHVMKKRWPEAEPVMKKDPEAWKRYTRVFPETGDTDEN